ncbi:MAG TPA: PTS transporter subunit EIIC [Candidatus Eremiobacteraceae bacterium]|nr:PTS transporter subunit EIIC [Candidatus Eremiobacteraceae bacterium]
MPRGGFERAIAVLEARVFPILRRAAEEPHMAAMREAIGPAFGALIVVSVAAYFYEPGPDPATRFFAAYHVGFGAMGLALAGFLAERLARTFRYDRIAAVALSLIAFYLSLPIDSRTHPWIAVAQISSTSIFLGLIVAMLTGEAMRIGCKRLPAAAGIAAAAVATVVVFGSLAAAGVSLGGLLLPLIRPLVAVGDTLPGLLVVVTLQTLLWCAGVHGPAFLSAIVTPVYLHALDQNSQAYINHLAPPHIVTIALATFFFPGGSGATLPFAVLLLRSKVARLRKLALASLLPSIANVNEPLIFGVPIVMNPTFALPFVGVPLVLATITYAAMALGLVDRTVFWVPPVNLLPAVIGAWIITGRDWRAVVLVAVNVALGAALYAPFLRAFENEIGRSPEEADALVQSAAALRAHELDVERHPEHLVASEPLDD